jgi:hypothetical protein
LKIQGPSGKGWSASLADGRVEKYSKGSLRYIAQALLLRAGIEPAAAKEVADAITERSRQNPRHRAGSHPDQQSLSLQ